MKSGRWFHFLEKSKNIVRNAQRSVLGFAQASCNEEAGSFPRSFA